MYHVLHVSLPYRIAYMFISHWVPQAADVPTLHIHFSYLSLYMYMGSVFGLWFEATMNNVYEKYNESIQEIRLQQNENLNLLVS